LFQRARSLSGWTANWMQASVGGDQMVKDYEVRDGMIIVQPPVEIHRKRKRSMDNPFQFLPTMRCYVGNSSPATEIPDPEREIPFHRQ